VPGRVLAPVLFVLVLIGTYAAENNAYDVAFVFVFGALGVAMERLDYSRPALLLGFVLGEMIERYFHVSLQAHGPLFFTRPVSLAIIAVAFACLLWPAGRRLAARWKSA
jgi:TctA family transporter